MKILDLLHFLLEKIIPISLFLNEVCIRQNITWTAECRDALLHWFDSILIIVVNAKLFSWRFAGFRVTLLRWICSAFTLVKSARWFPSGLAGFRDALIRWIDGVLIFVMMVRRLPKGLLVSGISLSGREIMTDFGERV